MRLLPVLLGKRVPSVLGDKSSHIAKLSEFIAFVPPMCSRSLLVTIIGGVLYQQSLPKKGAKGLR